MKSTRFAFAAALALMGSAGLAMADGAECRSVRLSDPGWTDITATNGVASVVLSALGYAPDVKTLSVPIGYESIKTGELDAFLGNWMPAQAPVIDLYDGTRLCLRGDVVAVTVNHRLNAFGYLHLAGIAGPAYAASGSTRSM